MNTPSHGPRSWWPFGRPDDDAPRLGPAEPSGVDWLDDGEPAPGPAPRPDAGAPDAPMTPPEPVPPTQPLPAEELPPTQPLPVGEATDAATPDVPADPPPGGMLVLGGPSAQPAPVAEGPAGEALVCGECGGSYGPDGYCENCGAKAPDPRLHFVVTVGPWLGGVCDRGLRHPGNQDALALRGADWGTARRAAMVVCDGVSTAAHSAEASLHAAGAAAAALATEEYAPGTPETPEARRERMAMALTAAVDDAAAQVAAVAQERGDAPDEAAFAPTYGGPSCTIVAALVVDDDVLVGSVGDSRAYWLPDDGPAVQLTEDDSWASEQVRAGVPREQAEAGPHAHTITRWLGADNDDHRPRLVPLVVDRPGWLLLCSDGLWNYASDAQVLAAAAREAWAALPVGAGGAPDATAAADALVGFAHNRGGGDNVTVALARLMPGAVASTPDREEA